MIQRFLRSENKKDIVIVVITIILIIGGLAYDFTKKLHKESLPVTQVQDIDINSLKEKFPEDTEGDLKRLSNEIKKAKEEKAPTYRYYTRSQEESDKKAQEYASKQKADRIIKTTTTKEIIGENKNAGNDNEKDENKKTDQIIENNYYAVNTEKKHRVAVGAAHIDKNSYITVGYQNRDVQYTTFYSPTSGNVGVGVNITIAKW
jgi:hypothetical protein